MNHYAIKLCAFLILTYGSTRSQAIAADLTLPVAGKVTIEFIFSDASFSNTLSLVTPTASIAISGCALRAHVRVFQAHALSSAKVSQRGCRITLDWFPAETSRASPWGPSSTSVFARITMPMASATTSGPAIRVVTPTGRST